MAGGSLRDKEHAARTFRGATIDSRTVKTKELFIALRGEQNDGHDYIRQAVSLGAAGVISESSFPGLDDISHEVPVVTVEDSHEAMMILAERYRETTAARRVGISGSNGKTTTKELAFQLIKAVEPDVYRSAGNLNNLYGMPLAILAMPQEAKVAIIEMGISMPGEMTKLARIARPDIMLITNVGPSHLEFLGSVEGVARAKLEAVRMMSEDQLVIINADDQVLVEQTHEIREDYVSFGIDNEATFRPSRVQEDSDGTTVVQLENKRFRLSLFGRHQVYNLLAAYAIARTLGYRFQDVDTETLELQLPPLRGEVVTSRGVTFILDCYNANPDSVKSGLKSFGDQDNHTRRLIILGDMLELGASSEQYHRRVGLELARQTFDSAALVGPWSQFVLEEAVKAGIPYEKLVYFENAVDCAEAMVSSLKKGDLVYVKGSRGIGLEEVLNLWREKEKQG